MTWMKQTKQRERAGGTGKRTKAKNLKTLKRHHIRVEWYGEEKGKGKTWTSLELACKGA